MNSPPPDLLSWAFWFKDSASVRDLLVSIVAVIGVPFLLWREFSTHRTAKAAVQQANTAAERHQKQTEADRERRITDSFTKAIELLSKQEMEARLGAIYSLEKISKESSSDHWAIIETLTAYVRTKSPFEQEINHETDHEPPANEDELLHSILNAQMVSAKSMGLTAYSTQDNIDESTKKIATDVQAILTILVRRNIGHDKRGQFIDLRNTELRKANLRMVNLLGAFLTDTDLGGADLTDAKLFGANLHRTNLYGAKLHKANLGSAKLHEANLYGANLYSANLRIANLRKANLYGAYLYGADLTNSNLSGANLYGALLYNANLHGADLTGANLSGAQLSGANLTEVNLDKANLSGTNFTGVNLSKAKNMDNARFWLTTMPDGTLNNRDCPPEEASPNSSETPPAPN